MLQNNYKSIFVTDLDIDIANYVTEILIKKLLEKYKKPLPNVAFWQKDIANANSSLKYLHDNYIRELPEVRKYLKVFSPTNLIEVFNKNKITSVFYLDKNSRKDLIYDLYLNQLKHVKSLDNRVQLETLDIKEFTKVPTLINNRKKIGL
jgi:hypothetical protein